MASEVLEVIYSLFLNECVVLRHFYFTFYTLPSHIKKALTVVLEDIIIELLYVSMRNDMKTHRFSVFCHTGSSLGI